MLTIALLALVAGTIMATVGTLLRAGLLHP